MLQFDDTDRYRGIVQEYEREIGANPGDISGNTTKLKLFAASANLALADFTAIAIQASGTWQWDDSNHLKHPIIKANVVSGQRDYTFTTDEQGNYILDIYKVAIIPSATAAEFVDLVPTDEQSETAASGFISETASGGIPTRYGKTGNSIFLDPVPNYSVANGLKLYINREHSYFTYDNPTKVPGIPGIFHRYLALRPAEDHARRNSLSNYAAIRAERLQMEKDIGRYFARREKDVRRRIVTRSVNAI
jgi:hypothetical protein